MSMGPADLQKLPVGFTAAMLERLPHTEAEIDARMGEAYSVSGYGTADNGLRIEVHIYAAFLRHTGTTLDVSPDFRRWVISKYTSVGWRRVSVEVDRMMNANYANVVFTFFR